LVLTNLQEFDTMKEQDKSITNFEPKKENKLEEIEPILINLISYIIEKEIEAYLNTLYADE